MILKLQQGGLPPFLSYEPITVTGGNSSPTVQTTTSSKSSTSTDLTDKDLIKLLKDMDGLPSDIAIIEKALQNFQIDQAYGYIDTGTMASRYISIIKNLKIAKFNKDQYTKIQENAIADDSLGEVAIDDRGRIYCVNQETKDYKLLTIDQLNKTEGYTPITNNDLLYLRAYDPSLANQQSVLSIVANGTSFKKIQGLIDDAISTLGTTSSTKHGYVKRENNKILAGVELLKEAAEKDPNSILGMSVDGMYKSKLITKEQSLQINAALNYLERMLPQNAKTLLKLKSDGTEQGMRKLLTQLFVSKTSPEYDFDFNLENKKSTQSSGDSSDSESGLKSSLPLNIQKSIGGYIQPMTIDLGEGIQMSINGTYYQQIKTDDGDAIINTSLETMLAESGLQSIVKNMQNITFGDQKLNVEQLSNITYNNTGVLRANLPVNADGSVRLDILEDFQQAEAEIELLGDNATDKQKIQIFKDHGLDDLLNSDGSLNRSKFAPFIVTEGYTTGNNGIQKSPYVHKIKNPTEQQINLIKASLTTGSGENKQTPEIDTFDGWYNPGDWFGLYDDIYKAAIYIPITNNTNAAAYGSNQKLSYENATQQEIKYRNFDKVSRMGSTSADIL